MSLPFVFYSELIEFCINLSVSGNKVTCMFAILDDAPYTATFAVTDTDWIQVYNCRHDSLTCLGSTRIDLTSSGVIAIGSLIAL